MNRPAYQRYAYYAFLILLGSAIGTLAKCYGQPETCEALSKPGALQAYVDGTLEATGRCELPYGTITIDEPLILKRRNGGTITGAGMPYALSTYKSGWNQKSKFFATRIVHNGTCPAIMWQPCIGFTIERLGVEASGIGIHYVAKRGWGGTMNRLTQVSFLGCEVGFQAGTNERDGNCADVLFDQCFFRRCGDGFKSVNHQAVNFRFAGCNWQRCKNNDIHCRRGGLVSVSGCYTYGTDTFLRIGHGGRGAVPNIINGLAMDRSPERDVAPVLMDAREASLSVYLDASGIKINGGWTKADGGEKTDRQLVYLQKHKNKTVEIRSISSPIQYQEAQE